MNISLFDYQLPKEQIAQAPMSPREAAKLMIVKKGVESVSHVHIKNFPDFLTSNDVLIINDTKVFKARLFGTLCQSTKTITEKKTELFLLRPEGDFWLALAKPSKKYIPGNKFIISENFVGIIIKNNNDGSVLIDFGISAKDVRSLANQFGSIPIPPYIKKVPTHDEYQTVYANQEGSVAAPTAGFHLTQHLLTQIKQKGVKIIPITLHVGIGTFQPIRTETIEDHAMHSEWVEVSQETAMTINTAKTDGKRIIAVGTTSVRAVEGVAKLNNGKLAQFNGDINIYISPGYTFSIVDAMLTNFHLPKSSLLVMVSAFAGRDTIFHAYHEAIKNDYRFYSFGDAMFIS